MRVFLRRNHRPYVRMHARRTRTPEKETPAKPNTSFAAQYAICQERCSSACSLSHFTLRKLIVTKVTRGLFFPVRHANTAPFTLITPHSRQTPARSASIVALLQVNCSHVSSPPPSAIIPRTFTLDPFAATPRLFQCVLHACSALSFLAAASNFKMGREKTPAMSYDCPVASIAFSVLSSFFLLFLPFDVQGPGQASPT